MGENKTEMSVLDPFIPKHYKGYDMDVLLQRLFDKKQITDEEEQALLEAQSIYRKKKFEENHKQWDEYKRAHPGIYRKNIYPQRTDKIGH